MPTYDYVCDACGHKFELFQSMKDDPQRKCPKCKKLKLRRLFGTGAAIVFKGSGFYQTDYRSDSYKQQASADKPAAESKSSDSGDKKSSEPKTESKPEKKADKGSDKGSGKKSE